MSPKLTKALTHALAAALGALAGSLAEPVEPCPACPACAECAPATAPAPVLSPDSDKAPGTGGALIDVPA